MNLRERIRVFMASDPFVPFEIVAGGGPGWLVESKECLTLDIEGSILCVMVRGGAAWTDVYVRLSQLVAVKRPATDLGPEEFAGRAMRE
jgi:hypothetical protein